MGSDRKRNLPRLNRSCYRGRVSVFWTYTTEGPTQGWLTRDFHTAYRELMLHAAARETLFCPAYCLMPEHLHLIWMGLEKRSDQLRASKFLRTNLNAATGRERKVATPAPRPCLAGRGTRAKCLRRHVSLHAGEPRKSRTGNGGEGLAISWSHCSRLSRSSSAGRRLLEAVLEIVLQKDRFSGIAL